MASLYSCGTYQSAYNYDDDGIYTTNNQQDEDEIIIVDKSEFDKSRKENHNNELSPNSSSNFLYENMNDKLSVGSSKKIGSDIASK